MIMKGKILGFNQAQGTGAISGEDGSRHSFALADWRGERPPAAGAAVDFESRDGQALEVYPVGGALGGLGNLNVDFGGLSDSPQGARITAMFTRSLAAPLALVIVAACFMSAISSPMMSVSLMDLGKVMDGLNLAGAASSMGSERGSGTGAIGAVLFLRFAAPIAAVGLIWTAWAKRPERLPMLVAGASAIGAALLVVGLKATALSMVPDFLRPQFSAAISLGSGVWLLLAAGGALIAAAMGKLRNPLAKG
jgi:hypothetical protein